MATSSAQQSPGVFVKEIDLSQRIDTISSTIGVAVGASKKGPIMQRTLVTSQKEFLDTFGHPDPTVSFMHYSALAFLEESQRLYVTRVVSPNALTAGAYATITDIDADDGVNLSLNNWDAGVNNNEALGIYDPLNTLAFDPNDDGAKAILFFVCAIDPGDWNNNLSVWIRHSAPLGLTPGSHESHNPYNFYIDVYVNFDNNTDKPVESFLVSRTYGQDGYGQQMFMEDVINTRSNYIRVKNNPYCPNYKIVGSAYEKLDGGRDGDIPQANKMLSAWEMYLDTESINVNLLINSGYTDAEYQLKMVEVAGSRRDCVAMLDIPNHLQKTADAITFRKETLNADSTYACLCTPDVKIYDKYNGYEIFVPPSGYFAQVCAKTDNNANLWYAPAGLNRGQLSVIGVNAIYNQGARDALDEAQINYIRFFPGRGYAIWAQNTLQIAASSLSNLNVRRLMNYVEKAISTYAQYSVFEPNDKVLRAGLRQTIERFLDPIKFGRGIYDYLVVCDDTNNPPYTVASGDLTVDVYLDPIIPSKRIHLNATITKTGAVFREAYANLSSSGLALNNQA